MKKILVWLAGQSRIHEGFRNITVPRLSKKGPESKKKNADLMTNLRRGEQCPLRNVSEQVPLELSNSLSSKVSVTKVACVKEGAQTLPTLEGLMREESRLPKKE